MFSLTILENRYFFLLTYLNDVIEVVGESYTLHSALTKDAGQSRDLVFHQETNGTIKVRSTISDYVCTSCMYLYGLFIFVFNQL